jgi:preprotein translocase subunit SecE
MSTKTGATASSKLDSLKWAIVGILLSAGIIGFYYFAEYSLLMRVISLLAIVGITTYVASTTQKGQSTLSFLKDTNVEVRRVVWPTRDETIKMTGVVILMVVLVAFIIWGVDGILFWLVRLFTGQGA